MYSINIRHLFHLRWREVIVCCIAFFMMGPLAAQSGGKSYNYRDFASKPYYFGITLAYNTSNYKVDLSKRFVENDSLLTAESITGPGFNLGVITNLKVGQYFDFRLLPTLSFAERNLTYARPKTSLIRERKVESVFVEIPFHVRYKSEPYNDMRFFLIAGVKYSFDVASDSRARQADDLVKVSPTDFAFETGVGVQFFFPYFIFSPEFKFSAGMNNILLFDPDLEQSTVVEKILSRSFTISLHFEG